MRLTFFILLLFTFLIPDSAESQQVKVQVDRYPRSYYASSTFEDRFRLNSHHTFSLRGGYIYKKNKVKHVELRNFVDQVYFMADIDTAGKIIRTGTKNKRFFIVNESYSTSPDHYTNIISYYEKEELVRVDSLIAINLRYEHLDTTMICTQRKSTRYYRGDLLNEKNAYLNENYLGVPIVNRWGHLTAITLDGESDSDYVYEPPNYFDSPLRTNYDSSTLYRYEYKMENYGAEVSVNDGHKVLSFDDHPILREHPFIKNTNSDYLSECIELGACMSEPITMHEQMWCGSSLYNSLQSDNSTHYGHKVREDGLYDSFHSDFYALDTTKYVPPPPDTTAASRVTDMYLVTPARLHPYGMTPPRRVSTPKRTIIYTFKYAFYEEE